MGEMELEPQETPAEPVVEEAPEWSGVSQEEWQQTQQYLQTVAPLIGQMHQYMQSNQAAAVPQEATQPALPDFDPFEPESVQSYIQAAIHQGLSSALESEIGPFKSIMGLVASREGETLARQELDSIKASVGEFDEDLAFLVASGMIEDGQDPSQALRTAATYSKDFETRIREDERKKYVQQLGELRGAPAEHSQTGPLTQEIDPVPTGPGRYREAVDRALARRTPVRPIG